MLTSGAETARPRLTWVRAEDVRKDDAVDFAQAVGSGLAQRRKSLPCRFFYDDAGSKLFEAICATPEYYVTRTEQAILEAYAADIVAAVPAPSELVELGSGSAVKTRLLIDALLARQTSLRYVPIDISRAALQQSAQHLLRDYPALTIEAVEGEYEVGLRHLGTRSERTRGGRTRSPGRLILWLGSNIGNLDRVAAGQFLGRIAAGTSELDRILVGFDLRKDLRRLLAAYDDAQGVTAAFNRNLLARINRELGGRFDPQNFEHRAVWNEAEGRIEMHLVSRIDQVVAVETLGRSFAFSAGESVHTESSYKYDEADIDAVAGAAGLRVLRRFEDAQGLFCVALLTATPRPRGAT